jgi:NAD(P) transhydrogenase subunit beta
VIGGAVGTVIAQRIQMTALPQLVAAFHSAGRPGGGVRGRGGLLCAGELRHRRARQFIKAEPDRDGPRHAIGAITFTGSVVAFAKLQGLISGNPLTFKGSIR